MHARVSGRCMHACAPLPSTDVLGAGALNTNLSLSMPSSDRFGMNSPPSSPLMLRCRAAAKLFSTYSIRVLRYETSWKIEASGLRLRLWCSS